MAANMAANMATTVWPRYQATPSKLRKSCDSCATTKVGCTKEKPKCARCAKHEQPCVYSAARRAGRISGGAQPRARRESTALTMNPISPILTTAETPGNTTGSSTPLGAGVFSPSLDLGRRQSLSSNPDIFAALTSPGDASLSSMPTNSFAELDELFASAVALPLGNPPDDDASGVSLFDFGLDDFNDHSSSSFSNLDSRRGSSCLFPRSSEANTAFTSQTPTSSGRGSVVARPDLDDADGSNTITALKSGRPYTSESSCQCLARALGLLARLSPGTLGWWNRDTDSDISPELPDFERIIAQNEQTSEGIRTILQCSCSDDSYLLVTLSLVVFKIIAWYTAAACAASGEDPIPGASSSAERPSHPISLEQVLPGPSTNRSDYDSEGEDQQRIAVQLILSKLAGVQVSVDQLSQRLPKIWDATKGDKARESPLESASTLISLAGGNTFTRPFSADLAHTLEADLRKRLYELSQAIVERLRQE